MTKMLPLVVADREQAKAEAHGVELDVIRYPYKPDSYQLVLRRYPQSEEHPEGYVGDPPPLQVVEIDDEPA